MLNDMDAAMKAMGSQSSDMVNIISNNLFGDDDEDALDAKIPVEVSAEVPVERKVNVNQIEVPQEDIDNRVMNNTKFERVSPELHAENKYWVRQLRLWQERYKLLSENIREAKDVIKEMKSPTRRSSSALNAMQFTARVAMQQRELIAYHLGRTAHPWV